ncbi:MAG: outer membrane protein assembly factor BamD [Rhizobiales bacterium]|nr:outer membrane protein assembly factor BamD [Hyphomicrobiales bacterium]
MGLPSLRVKSSPILILSRCSGAVARALALTLALTALGGCSSIGEFFNKGRNDIVPEVPADQLYNEGLYLLNQKNDQKAAAKRFEEVDRQHPYSEWARKSLLMSAYAHYDAREYDEAVTSAKRFLTLHPSSNDAAYAQYIIGSSYYDQIPDISRDQAGTRKAVAALEEVIRKYPDTEYAASARKKLEIAHDNLAAGFVCGVDKQARVPGMADSELVFDFVESFENGLTHFGHRQIAAHANQNGQNINPINQYQLYTIIVAQLFR